MRRVAAALLALVAGPVSAQECVVLLHGLGRTHLSMLPMELALRQAGYDTWNKSYPSTRKPIEALAEVVGEAIDDCKSRDAERVHFVTHSLGGILLRAYFQDKTEPIAGRAVMLAPPNKGSEIVDRNRDEWWFRAATGPSGQQLGTGADSLPSQLKPIELEVGIIAGTKSSDPWFNGAFDGDHDGKVSKASTHLDGMKELVTVDAGHTLMMNSPQVIRLTKTFLTRGSFQEESP